MTTRRWQVRTLVAVLMTGGLLAAARADDDDRRRPNVAQLQASRNDSGVALTISTNGFIDRRNPFFRELGTNQRACVTCHQPGEGWSDHAEGPARALRRRRKATTRCFAWSTAPTRRTPTSRPSARARRPTACCSTRA